MTGRKLDEFDVVAIRSDHRTVTMIAADYGVAPTMISRIQLGQAWKHLPGARQARRAHTDRGGRHLETGGGPYARMSHNYRYTTWLAMVRRCTDAAHRAWEWYGGRGITVCERWLADFRAFVDDMGERPSAKHSLDRINNDLGYSPDNCRWATASEQAYNRRPPSERKRLIRVDGLSFTALAKLHDIGRKTLERRYREGKRGADLVAPDLKETPHEWKGRAAMKFSALRGR